ncbi:MAG: hypothetical protein QOC64_3484, partial [Solirubrobacteraceae bacterium]|nr:hypothetical protein [Solirubrobacteraceae bacterium]
MAFLSPEVEDDEEDDAESDEGFDSLDEVD